MQEVREQQQEKEQEEQKLSVRKHGEGDLGNFSLDEFITYFNDIIAQSLHK
jgi:threonyl-tRNA synthetase